MTHPAVVLALAHFLTSARPDQEDSLRAARDGDIDESLVSAAETQDRFYTLDEPGRVPHVISRGPLIFAVLDLVPRSVLNSYARSAIVSEIDGTYAVSDIEFRFADARDEAPAANGGDIQYCGTDPSEYLDGIARAARNDLERAIGEQLAATERLCDRIRLRVRASS